MDNPRDTAHTELPRRTGLGRLAAGALVAVGMALAAASPAAADDWKGGHGKHWKQHGHYYHPGHYPPGHHKKHKHQPHVVYYQPAPVYVYPQPVYVAPPPPPPVYYVQPAPVYAVPPQVSIVFPIKF